MAWNARDGARERPRMTSQLECDATESDQSAQVTEQNVGKGRGPSSGRAVEASRAPSAGARRSRSRCRGAHDYEVALVSSTKFPIEGPVRPRLNPRGPCE